MVSSILFITLQVEHTKERNIMDSEASLWNETPNIRIV